MTKYEILYGVTIEHFPFEEENVREKLRLATDRYAEVRLEPYSEEQQMLLYKLAQAKEWATKILKDINDE